MTALRTYAPDELGPDGYPPEWHLLPITDPLLDDADLVLPGGIKHAVRALAGHRCVRCQHPYRNRDGEWSRCDARCTHGMPARCEAHPFDSLGQNTTTGALIREAAAQGVERIIEAQWRILTVHHLDLDKANCRWWNLAPLCQRCHLTIQGRVLMARVWPWEHTEWFRPYVAGYYAWTYLHEDLTRAQAEARLDELLALERITA